MQCSKNTTQLTALARADYVYGNGDGHLLTDKAATLWVSPRFRHAGSRDRATPYQSSARGRRDFTARRARVSFPALGPAGERQQFR
jgi:hypothetical protein